MKYLREDLKYIGTLLQESYPEVVAQVVGEFDEFSEILKLPPLRAANAIRKYAGIDIPLIDSLIPRPYYFTNGDIVKKISAQDFQASDDEIWLYINGVMVDQEMLAIQGRWLAKIFGKPFLLLHNPTDGVIVDILESVLGRNFGIEAIPGFWMTKRIQNLLDLYPEKKINIVAHSQGCIILSRCLQNLAKQKKNQLNKLSIYTFASPAKFMPKVGFAEHYANIHDLVAQFGILHPDRKITGHIFTRSAKGHWLNTHYLPALMHGEFGRTSLYEIIKSSTKKGSKLPSKVLSLKSKQSKTQFSSNDSLKSKSLTKVPSFSK